MKRGILVALMAAATLAVAVVSSLGPRREPSLPPLANAPEEPGVVALGSSRGPSQPDLDGDQRADVITAGPAGLTVVAGAGGKLLDFPTRVDPNVRVLALGGEYPVLFARTGEQEWAAFAYDPGAGVLRTLTWPGGRYRGEGEVEPDGTLRLFDGRESPVYLRVSRWMLEAGRPATRPFSQPRLQPSEALVAVLEATAYRLEPELAVHFVREADGKSFYRAWNGKWPEGTAAVERADQLDAGAQNGHTVPFRAWIAGDEAVAAVAGETRFRVERSGVLVETLSARAVPLKVATWTEAARLAKLSQTTPRIKGGVFVGRFRFRDGPRIVAVDALTGQVETE